MTRDRRTPEEIERDLERNRAVIDETVTALEQKLSPGQLMDRVLDVAREHGGTFGRNLTRTVEANPMPVLLTAGGLIWLAASGTRRHEAHVYAAPEAEGAHEGSMGERVRERAQAVGERGSQAVRGVGEATRRAGETARDVTHRAGEAARTVTHRAGEAARGVSHRAGTAAQRTGQFVEDYPLAGGLIGFGLGALLAAMIPRSRFEEETIGPYSERLRHRLSETASDIGHRAAEVGRAVVEETDRARREEGLTSEDAAERTRRTVERGLEAGRAETERQLHEERKGSASGRARS